MIELLDLLLWKGTKLHADLAIKNCVSIHTIDMFLLFLMGIMIFFLDFKVVNLRS